MRSDQKQRLQGIVAATLLVGVPFLLNACSGNPLNGEPFRLWKNSEASTPAPGPKTGLPPNPKPTSAQGQSGTSCNPNITGALEPNDGDLVNFNAEVSKIELTQPQRSELKGLIIAYAGAQNANLGLTGPERKELVGNILQRSPAQPPTPSAPTTPGPTLPAQPKTAQAVSAPGPAPLEISASSATLPNISNRGLPDPKPVGSSHDENVATPTAAAAVTTATPSYLHASIVTFIAYKHAITLALDHGKLNLGTSDAIKFANDLIFSFALPSDTVILAYSKAFALAMAQTHDGGLGYSPAKAQEMVSALIKKPNGVPMALAWVGTYTSDIDYGYKAEDAIKDANQALGYTPDDTDPVSGFCGAKAPAAKPAAAAPAVKSTAH